MDARAPATCTKMKMEESPGISSPLYILLSHPKPILRPEDLKKLPHFPTQEPFSHCFTANKVDSAIKLHSRHPSQMEASSEAVWL
ncbi:hypothetical protein MSG28_015307 [Choristoneura fumiferana]|uniref:Uncharacterized protein n=1 Tax=Choristoneura fumiferana TaxID=7141 RepID=A0ACC0KA07_CHOFU|nr:hypothetical protein MSG28_015307 [Choristoneura fumiferana]